MRKRADAFEPDGGNGVEAFAPNARQEFGAWHKHGYNNSGTL